MSELRRKKKKKINPRAKTDSEELAIRDFIKSVDMADRDPSVYIPQDSYIQNQVEDREETARSPQSITPISNKRKAAPEVVKRHQKYKEKIEGVGFNPDAYAADVEEESFDPDAYLNENPSSQRASKLKSSGAGIAQGVTLGYTPQIVGGGASLVGMLQDLIQGPVIDPKTGKAIPRTDYLTARDATVKDIQKSAVDNPVTYGVTNFASGMALPGGQAKTLSRAALYPAIYGAAYNPGDKEGDISPLQLGDRFVNSAIGGTAGVASKLIGQAIGAAGRAARTKGAMEKPGFEQNLRTQVTDAADKLQSEYITPRSRAAREALKYKEVTFSPNILNDADKPGLKAALQARTMRAKNLAEQNLMAGTGASAPRMPGDDLVTLRADIADRLRRRLDEDAWKNKSALATPEIQKSAEGQAYAANVLRSLREKVAPELADNFKQQSYGIGLKRDLVQGSKSPQSLLTSGYLGDQGGKLTDVDSLVGTNLRQTGADLLRARMLSAQPQKEVVEWTTPFNWLARQGLNVGAQAARPMNRMGEISSSAKQAILPTLQPSAIDALIRSVLEQKRLGAGQ